MKSPRLMMALAVAATCAWSANALAAGAHTAHMSPNVSIEVQTPSSVDESAPWLNNDAHLGGWPSSQPSFGSVSPDPLTATQTTDYWLIGSKSDEANVGSSASEGASGSISFDSSRPTRGEDPRL